MKLRLRDHLYPFPVDSVPTTTQLRTGLCIHLMAKEIPPPDKWFRLEKTITKSCSVFFGEQDAAKLLCGH